MRFWGQLTAAAAAIVMALPVLAADNGPLRDEFFWLNEMNKATTVINTDEGLLDKSMAAKIARGIQEVIEDGAKPGAKRSDAILRVEPLLIKKVGMDATRLHVGRSSQDMHATYRSAMIRDNLIVLMNELNETMAAIDELARRNVNTIVPNYTNGVAAQPNSYAHYLMGFQAAFARDAQRIREFYKRVNLCAMGTTVLNGTRWPLNRDRMASYLGFAGPVPDAYDAGQIKSMDEPVELAQIVTSIALHVGQYLQDISVQYAQPRPWILLEEGKGNTYASSAMPQKRNPGLMMYTRVEASKVVGKAHTVEILAHNITPGMPDPKDENFNDDLVKDTLNMLTRTQRVIKALKINPDRALEELNSDWTASQEIADIFVADYGLPFRVGHHVASGIVSWARAHNVKPLDFPYAEVQRIYTEVVSKEWPEGKKECPMPESVFRKALDPKAIVAHRRTAGGPQPAEMQKALARMSKTIAENRTWAQEKKKSIDNALGTLDADFQKLVDLK